MSQSKLQTITITPQNASERLDHLVVSANPAYPRSVLQRLIKDGFVLVNNKPAKPSYRVRNNDKVSIDTSFLVQEVPSIDIPVIYEDDDVVVIDKPAGLLSHNKSALNLEPSVATWLRSRNKSGDPSERAGIVHRLDRDTSGVMICAKNEHAQSMLQKQFADRDVDKTYIAIVEGAPKHDKAIIEWPIARNPSKPQTFVVRSSGKPATTEYEVIDSGNEKSLLRLTPHTGRTHQLRVHLKHLGNPILGDPMYGKTIAERMFLHAESLRIKLPSGKTQTFSSPVPASFLDTIKT